ncbi:MAG: four helix bundle protein [Candidatus Levybacteria bacterium]|nr:four helix bundle protein [Candidatus Levybacteria bacterium]
MATYKELIVWKKAIELVKEIYLLTEKFPRSEIYGIISQMRRAAVSIPSNIAEGYGRKSPKEYAQFYSIAYGSGLELETQLIISKDLKFVKLQDFTKSDNLLTEVLKMLRSMLYTMRTKR